MAIVHSCHKNETAKGFLYFLARVSSCPKKCIIASSLWYPGKLYQERQCLTLSPIPYSTSQPNMHGNVITPNSIQPSSRALFVLVVVRSQAALPLQLYVPVGHYMR